MKPHIIITNGLPLGQTGWGPLYMTPFTWCLCHVSLGQSRIQNTVNKGHDWPTQACLSMANTTSLSMANNTLFIHRPTQLCLSMANTTSFIHGCVYPWPALFFSFLFFFFSFLCFVVNTSSFIHGRQRNFLYPWPT